MAMANEQLRMENYYVKFQVRPPLTTGLADYAYGCHRHRPVGVDHVSVVLSDRRRSIAVGIGAYADGPALAVGIV